MLRPQADPMTLLFPVCDWFAADTLMNAMGFMPSSWDVERFLCV